MSFRKEFFVETSKDLLVQGDYTYSASEFIAIKQDDGKLRGFLGMQRYSEKNLEDYGAFAMEIGDHDSIAAIKKAGNMLPQRNMLESTLLKDLTSIDESKLEQFDLNDKEGFEKAVTRIMNGTSSTPAQDATPLQEQPQSPRSFQAAAVGLGKLGF